MTTLSLIAATIVSYSTIFAGASQVCAETNAADRADTVSVANYRGGDSDQRRMTNFYRRNNLIRDRKRSLRQRNYRFCYMRHGRRYCRTNGYSNPQ